MLSKRAKLLLAVCLAAVAVVASFGVLYENHFLVQGSGVVWQRSIENFATGLAADNVKVFTNDLSENVNSYDIQSGNSIWNGSVASYFASGITAADGKVYAGKRDAQVGCFDEATGDLQWVAQAPVSSDLWGSTPPSDVRVVDGRLFLTADGTGAFNASTGQLLWQYTDYSNVSGEHVWWVRAYPFEGNLVFAATGSTTSISVYRLNADDGSILWRVNNTFLGGDPVVYNNQVIMPTQNRTLPDGSSLTDFVSLNIDDGARLWNYSVDAATYQPVEYNGLLLFGVADGNFYALNATDGTLAWKTKVDNQNLFSQVNQDNPATTYPIQIDTQNSRAFWAFAVTQHLGTTSENAPIDQYNGILCSIDLASGNVIWIKQFQNQGSVGTNFGLVKLKDTLYLTASNDLWLFSASMGFSLGTQHFEHYVLPSVASGDRVFVAGDLSLTAYG